MSTQAAAKQYKGLLMKKKYNWKLLYLAWLQRNLEQELSKPYTYSDLGTEFNIPHKTIRNHAAKEKWQDRLAVEKSKIEQQILSTIQASQVESESEVRQRQAKIARTLLDKAIGRIENIKTEDLTPKQAIEIIKFALPEERKALGLADRHEVTNIQREQDGEYLSVEDRKQRIKQAGSLANKLFEFINSQDKSIATDCNQLQ